MTTVQPVFKHLQFCFWYIWWYVGAENRYMHFSLEGTGELLINRGLKRLSSKERTSPWGHLGQAEWWCILGPAWRRAHNSPSQCQQTITRGLLRPGAPSRPPPLPHEANHVIWCNDRVMTQIGGVFSLTLQERGAGKHSRLPGYNITEQVKKRAKCSHK